MAVAHHRREFLRALVMAGAVAPLVAALSLIVLWNTPGGSAAGNVITSPDTAGDVGFFTSLALDGSGNPVVIYGDRINNDLKVLHCGDANCSSGNVIALPVPSGSLVGRWTSLALDGSGNPVVSYLDLTGGDLKVLHCGDPNCSSGNVVTSPDTGPVAGEHTSLVLDGGGNPVVSYSVSNFPLLQSELKVLHCGDPNCSSGNVITSPDAARSVGGFTSLALDGAGNPVVSYYDYGNNELKVLHCGDPNCSSGNAITSPDTAAGVGWMTSLALDGSGNPVVSYWDRANLDLKVLHCGDANCSSGNVITSPDTAGDVGEWTSLALDGSGNPVVSYLDHTDGGEGFGGDLKVLHCGDPNCSSGNVITSPDTALSVGWFTSLALDGSGKPVVSYYDHGNLDLKVLHCGDPNCGGAPPTNTPTGSDVCVPLAGDLEICFSGVSGGGDTTVVTSSGGPPPPTGLKIVGTGGQPLYYDFSTTATFSGLVTVCIAYDGTDVPGNTESQLKLFHHDGSVFSDITTSLDTTNDIICGETTTLSPFAVMVPIPPSVGGIVELHVPPVDSSQRQTGSGSFGLPWIVLAAGVTALGLGAVARNWYVRRRAR